MAKIEIVESLYIEIEKKFKQEGHEVIDLINTTKDNPKKGKIVGSLGGIVIKELKYKSFRFYFLADGHKLKFYSEEELVDLLLKFVRMSDKKHQEETIKEIREILLKIGAGGFK
jgi:hypothetical protein